MRSGVGFALDSTAISTEYFRVPVAGTFIILNYNIGRLAFTTTGPDQVLKTLPA